MKTLSAHQLEMFPSLPLWNKIFSSDIFILLDNIQVNGLHNRFQILTPNGEMWLTIPCKRDFPQFIHETIIDNTKNWKKAAIYYEKALSITPKNAEYHDEAGKLYSRLFMLYQDEEYFEKAVAHFKKSYRQNPYNAWAHYHLAWCYLEKRMYKEAEKEAKQAIRLDPNNATYHWQLAAIYERMGKLEEAKEEYQEVLRIMPGYSKAKRALKKIEKKLQNTKNPL